MEELYFCNLLCAAFSGDYQWLYLHDIFNYLRGTVKISCFSRAKWTFARADHSVELGNWYLGNRVNLSQYFLSRLRKKKNSQSISKVKST